MSKKAIVEIVESGGHSYGQISRPSDFVKAQEYVHAHVEQLTKDFLTQFEGETAGCDITALTGLAVHISEGRTYRDGLQYESDEADLTLNAAHATLARIDLIVATLAEDAPANPEFLAFQRLRTDAEFNANTPPYPPTQFQRSTERNNIATISRKTGTPSATPQPPALATNEVALFRISVAANAASLTLPNVTDVRKVVSNLRAVNSLVATHSVLLAQHQISIDIALNYEQQVRNFNTSFGRYDSLANILNDIAQRLQVLRYRYPTMVSSDNRCPAQAHLDGSTYVVDIPVSTAVEFGDRFVGIDPAKFADQTLNPHYTNASGNNFDYLHLVQGESFETNASQSPTGNVVRFNVPATMKYMYLLYDGSVVFRSTVEASNSEQCLLLKITPKPGSTPDIKAYRNLRAGKTGYTKVATSDAASKQFDLDIGEPLGTFYIDAYAIRASDNSQYKIDVNIPAFDAICNVAGVTNGDTWFVILTTLSAL